MGDVEFSFEIALMNVGVFNAECTISKPFAAFSHPNSSNLSTKQVQEKHT